MNKSHQNKLKKLAFTVVDLFCGCGGMSLGFQNAGFNIIGAYDNWDPALTIYKKNFTHPVHNLDLKEEDAIKHVSKLHPEIIIGGPPCQDFSSAGHRNETLGRADLTISFAKIVAKAKPRYFVMENVPRITKSHLLKKVMSIFNKIGYGLTAETLDASYCGVPQSRKRFFLIGHLDSPDNFLSSTLTNKMSSSPMSIYDYLGDSLGVEYYFRIPRSYNRRAVFSIYEPCVTLRGVDRPIPKGYKKHPGDLVEIGDKVRALTILERSYLQTFPKSYVFEGTKSNLNQIIGNAVPVKLAEFVGEAIQEYEQNRNGVSQ